MIWAIIGIIVAIILGCTALFFHQKQRKHSWIPAILAVITLAGSGLYARHEVINHSNKPHTAQQAKRQPTKNHQNKINNRKSQKQQNNKSAKEPQKQQQKKQGKPVNNKWANLKHKAVKFIVVAAIMALLAGAIIDG